jgi:pantoate--beta-alanine ligase
MGKFLPRAGTGAELRRQVAAWRKAGDLIAFVPTMGALHEGHLALVRRGRELAERVVASIFVNPAQFGPHEDFNRYPRPVERDCELLEAAGCDLVFLPAVEEIYPPGSETWVTVEGPSQGFEGDSRPGHFRGVATVVAKLFNLVQPDLAIFGEKDAQQLAVIRRLVRDLAFPIEIVGYPIVREKDGLALSSRNVYLSPEERRDALALSRSLRVAQRAIAHGELGAERLIALVRRELEGPGEIDYVGIVDADSFASIDVLDRRAVLPLVVRFGKTRLLDNLQIEIGPGGQPVGRL